MSVTKGLHSEIGYYTLAAFSLHVMLRGLTRVHKIWTLVGTGVNHETYFEDEVVEVGGYPIEGKLDDLFIRELVTLWSEGSKSALLKGNFMFKLDTFVH